ncbi:MAG: hypothetical protein U1F52_06275 [Burkholderiales bacterium]
MSDTRDAGWEAELASASDIRARVRSALRTDEPPADLDAAILAAAHRAVGAGPRPVRSGWLGRWRVPLSAAAVLVLATSLSVLYYEEGAHRRAWESGAPAPASAPSLPPRAAPDASPSSVTVETKSAGPQRMAPASEMRRPEVSMSAIRESNVAKQAEPDRSPKPQVPLPATPPAMGAAAPVAPATEAPPTPVARPFADEASRSTSSGAAPSPGIDGARDAEARLDERAPVRASASRSDADRPAETVESRREAAPAAPTPSTPAETADTATLRAPLPERARPLTKSLSGALTSRSRLADAEALWRAGREDEARAVLRRWRCEHPEATTPPTGFPIPFDERSRCPRDAAKEGWSPDR